MRHPRPSAFTLIEMLVVISIITLLIAITQPSLGKSKENARRALCASQVRQQGIGMTGFANDSRQRYPQAVPTSHWPDGAMTQNWAQPDAPAGQAILFAKKYVPDARAFYCPSNVHSQSSWASIDTGWTPNDWRNTYVHYPYWAGYRSVYDAGNMLARLVADGPSDSAERVIASDNITLDTGPAHFNSVSRNHLGEFGKPAGGNVLRNDTSAHWRSFSETTLRVQVPVGAAHQRDFWF